MTVATKHQRLCWPPLWRFAVALVVSSAVAQLAGSFLTGGAQRTLHDFSMGDPSLVAGAIAVGIVGFLLGLVFAAFVAAIAIQCGAWRRPPAPWSFATAVALVLGGLNLVIGIAFVVLSEFGGIEGLALLDANGEHYQNQWLGMLWISVYKTILSFVWALLFFLIAFGSRPVMRDDAIGAKTAEAA